MFLIEWYRQYKQVKQEFETPNEYIESLKHEIEVLRAEKNKLLESLLNPRVPEPTRVPTGEFNQIPTSNRTPWRVKRQELVAADRLEADKLRKIKNEELKAPPDSPEISVDDLEKELDIVTQERESNAV